MFKTISTRIAIASLFVIWASILEQAHAQTITCADTACFVTNAQLTILATINSTNLNDPGTSANATNYNATVGLQCAFYSSVTADVTSLRQQLSNAVGGAVPITVTGWGRPNSRCANNQGAEAIAGTTKVLFVYIAVGAASTSVVPTFAVFDICQGGLDPTTSVLTTIAQLQRQNPANVLNVGSNCTLPALPSTTTVAATTSTSAPTASPTGAGTTVRSSICLLLLGTVAVMFAIFA